MTAIPGLKNEGIAILLSALVCPGAGQFYLGNILRGLLTMFITPLLGLFALVFFPIFPFGLVVPLGFYIWQIFDARKYTRWHNEDTSRAYYSHPGTQQPFYGPRVVR